MYRFVLIGLYIVAGFALVLSLIGVLAYSPVALIISYAVVMLASWLSNYVTARVVNVRPNPESWHITALILFLLVFPQQELVGLMQVALIAVIAMLSKYLLVFRGRHIFNPAAIAVVISSALGLLGASWWVGNIYLLPVVGIIGTLVVWKLRLFSMVAVYVLGISIMSLARGFIDGAALGDMLSAIFLSSPLVFLATIMLTEPLTMPPTKRLQWVYGGIIGVLQGLGLGWASKPDVALSVGALGSFFASIRHTAKLRIIRTSRVAGSIYETILAPSRPLTFSAGQYIEVSLPHAAYDTRGTRRVFSIASAPHTGEIRLAYSVPPEMSSFKKALLAAPSGTLLHGHRVAGDFTLPKNNARPVTLIAGGIGLTPFLSMLHALANAGDKRQVVLIYAARDESNLAYVDELRELSARLNLQVRFVVDKASESWQGARGRLSYDTLRQLHPGLAQSTVYISGPIALVRALKYDILRNETADIRTDYFSGL